MKKLLLFCSLACLCTSYLFAQTSTIKPDKACINCPTDEPASSAVFEIQSTDKGILLPRMTTTERTNISSPAAALLVYDTDTQSFWYYNATQWQELGASLSNQNLAQVLAEGNDANSLKIVNLSDPSNPQDAATKSYVDANDEVEDADADPSNEIQTLSSVLTEGNDANNTLITNLANPINGQDAATKAYVDASDEVDDADADPMNELQDLSLSGETLSLSDDATTVDLSAFLNNWTIYGAAPIVFGFNNTVAGDSSSAVGYTNRAVGFQSNAFGNFNDATGDRSSAVGYLNDATGDHSNAFGYFNDATGEDSNAVGYFNDATGEKNSAFGVFNIATGDWSSAFGYSNEAVNYSNAFGNFNNATGRRSSAFGYLNIATGDWSSAFGFENEATGDRSSAFGYRTLSDVYSLMTVGCFNADPVGSATTWVATEPVFVVGNGENFNSRSTALTILKNGNVGIGDETPEELLEVNGNVKATKFIGDGSMLTNLNSDNNWTTYGAAPIIFGFNNTVAGDSSSAVGYTNKAVGFRSSAFGYINDATGNESSAFGNFNDATGVRSSAFGYANFVTGAASSAVGYFNDATGGNSSAVGYLNQATGDLSSAFGYSTLSDVYGLMAVGRFNADPVGSSTTWVATEPVFVVGNGEDASNRSTALTILKNGNVGIGDETPDELLEVNGNVKATKFIGDGSMLTNVAQDLSLSGDTLNLSDDATAVDLSAFLNNWMIADGRDATFGYNNVATGDSSTAVGYNNIADNTFSNAFGTFNIATEFRSNAFGYFNEASGTSSSAFGLFNDATGGFSSAFGSSNNAAGDYSSAFGYLNNATGDRSSAFGYLNDATGDQSSAFGYRTLSDVYGLMAVGHYNADPVGSATTWIPTEPVFVVGNGENSSSRSTALTILKNGNVGIGTTTPDHILDIIGDTELSGSDNDGTTNAALKIKAGTQTMLLDGNEIDVIGGNILYLNGNAGGDVSLTTAASGNVGIGTASATAKLDVNGTARIRSLPSGSGTTVVADGNGNLLLSSSSPNVNEQRINDLQEENTSLKTTVVKLEAENEAIKARLAKIEALLSGKVEEVNTTTSTLTSASLSQNAPNPFDEVTTISYFIPEHIKSASLQVMDQNGRIIKRIPIQATGNGQITLQANLLSAGTYSYSLILDGRVMETKQMVLTH